MLADDVRVVGDTATHAVIVIEQPEAHVFGRATLEELRALVSHRTPLRDAMACVLEGEQRLIEQRAAFATLHR